jgi:PAS domain S-box-containing protein
LGWYDRDGGRAVLVTALVAVLGAVTWRAAVLLDRSDAERRRAETALRESEERYRLLFELSPEPVWVFDIDTLQFLAVNAAAIGRYGYSAEEFRSMTIRDIRPPEDIPRLLERVVHLGEQPSTQAGGPWRHRTKDGMTLEVEITSHMLMFEGKRAQLVLAHDITERRRVEAALQASEEQFRTLAVTANDAIISAEASGDITYFNPAGERIFGYTASEVTGRPLTVLMPERFHELHRRGLDRYLSTGVAHVIGRTVELVGKKRDGTEFPIELSLASWRREHEAAFTAVIRDITARKQADDELKLYAAQLEAANAELDAFAYSVSHDLRAPLRSIDGFSLALLEDSDDRLDAAGRDHLRRVRAAAQRMALLIDDLLGLSRVTRAALQREPVDLSAIAGAVAAELERSEPGRCVEFAIAPGLGAEGDPRLLRVVLENLLGNAWKYTGKNLRARIEFAATEAGGARAYYVRDDGAGFEMAYADKLFGAFQRLHSNDEFEGTGIGLATVQRIVHRHGGRVWAEGAVGRGATFYFTL